MQAGDPVEQRLRRRGHHGRAAYLDEVEPLRRRHRPEIEAHLGSPGGVPVGLDGHDEPVGEAEERRVAPIGATDGAVGECPPEVRTDELHLFLGVEAAGRPVDHCRRLERLKHQEGHQRAQRQQHQHLHQREAGLRGIGWDLICH
ncbi:hypothetical protein ACFQFG_09890 [Methylobacterium persicinum]